MLFVTLLQIAIVHSEFIVNFGQNYIISKKNEKFPQDSNFYTEYLSIPENAKIGQKGEKLCLVPVF